MNKDQNLILQGTLFVVALPIGNIFDLSPRAREVLSHVDIIAAEDTRVFSAFANELTIPVKRLVSYHDHNEKESAEGIIRELKKEKSVALVSDAGTPRISDPGYSLLLECYKNSIPVIGIPGPSALTLALSICPIGGVSHFFGGFAPSTSHERKKVFLEKCHVADRIIFFESPHRIIEHLQDAKEYFQGKIFILREATKKYEETLFMETIHLIQHFQDHPPKGEFVIIYPGQSKKSLDLPELKKEIQKLISENLKPTEIWKQIQDLTKLTRREIYDLITEIKHRGKSNND